MVAELLRLKLRLLLNAFRMPGAAAWAAFGIVLAGFGVALLWGGASLATALDELTLRRVVVVVGAMVSLAAFFVPVVAAGTHIVHPRALRFVGLSRAGIAFAILLLTLVGPALLLVPIALTPLFVWTGDSEGTAALMVPLIVLEGILAARVGVVVGAVVKHRPVPRAISRILALGLLIAGGAVLAAHLAPTVAELLPGAWWRITLMVVLVLAPLRDPAIADTITALPIGAFWRVPAHESAGEFALVEQDLVLGLVAVVVLLAVWLISLGHMLRPTRRVPRQRAARVPGWFRRLPATPTGAVAARSFSYWARDPRYRTALAVLPVVPLVTLLAMWIAGVPWDVAVLVPLPIVVLLLVWGTLHNDVAYDSTAIWAHVSAHVRGVQDRVGRMLPVLAMGIPVVVGGTALTAWAYGDWAVTPGVLGVAVGLLFGGIGVASLISARFPYPATRPGDAPFQQPFVPGSSGSSVQAGSLVLTLLVAAPALGALVLGVLGFDGPWFAIALVAGLGLGLIVFAAGIRAGGAVFDRRAPELLEFTARN